MVKTKTLIIVQARMGSKRLPNKVMRKIDGKPLIEILYDRLKYSKYANEIIIASTYEKNENELINFCKKKKYKYFLGSENDLLDRFIKAAKKFDPSYVVRVTGDCPLIDAKVIDEAIKTMINKKADYVCNVFPPTYPDGYDVDVIPYKLLKKLKHQIDTPEYREYFTRFIKHNKSKYKIINLKYKRDISHLRLTVDEDIDLEVIERVYKNFRNNKNFSVEDLEKFVSKNIRLFKKNKVLVRNEGSYLNEDQKLWRRAKTIIPGGNMLLSKNPERYLPDHWPAYFKKAKGCEIWGLDKKKYLDMSSMGIGTNVLGYSNRTVDEFVINKIKMGNISTLNSPEEVELTEKLLKIHKWAGMAKFTRSGGEANALAIRIARSFSKKHNVAFCGYHGWHDWYLSSAIGKKDNLKFHLLPNLEIKGVPESLRNTSFPFKYGDLKGLKKLILNKNIGIIKLEVCRNTKPNIKFLKEIRKICNKKNIVLIFDECTTGFRQSLAGLHNEIKIYPDIVIYGKAMGNGYPINAVIGKKKIMSAASKTFISSTFWTERLGPSAALKTIHLMEKNKTYLKVKSNGLKVMKIWEKLAKKHKINIKIYGIPSLAKFEIKSRDWPILKSFIINEFLKKKILATNLFYPSIAHKPKYIKRYEKSLDDIFKKIKNTKNKLHELRFKKPIKEFNRLN